MEEKLQISLLDLILHLSDILDMISPDLVNHNKRVSYIAYQIAKKANLSSEECTNVLLAALLHDCGAIYTENDINVLKLEYGLTGIDRHKHGYLGYLLLKTYEPLKEIAYIIKHHHVYFNEISSVNEKVPIESLIIHLADRIEITIDLESEILAQVDGIIKRVDEQSGEMFSPYLVDIFKELARKESFWFDITSRFSNPIKRIKHEALSVNLYTDETIEATKLFHRIIDFRSNFTATHSIGVSVSAEMLARYYGFSEKECKMIKIAGLIHDIGKLIVPKEILEKPGALTDEEFNIIKSHAYYSYRVLVNREENNLELRTIAEWAAFHHENLDGSGYPFHLTDKELSVGSRIMAVADVFTAITEDRPYRKGMNKEKVINILNQMVENKKLDKNIVTLLLENYDEINKKRIKEQAKSYEDYIEFDKLR